MKVSEISEILNNWMPTSIAEDYDNVGLIVGNPDSLVTNILITLDTTNEVIDEAVKKKCNLKSFSVYQMDWDRYKYFIY